MGERQEKEKEGKRGGTGGEGKVGNTKGGKRVGRCKEEDTLGQGKRIIEDGKREGNGRNVAPSFSPRSATDRLIYTVIHYVHICH